jgi:hypothetical protein
MLLRRWKNSGNSRKGFSRLARKTHKKASKAASYLCKVLLRNKLTLQKGRRFDDRL